MGIERDRYGMPVHRITSLEDLKDYQSGDANLRDAYDFYTNRNYPFPESTGMNGLMKYPVAESTGRATEGIDNIIASNKADYEASLPQPKPEATLGPTPWMETDEGQQTLMDIAMGNAFPGAAIGRVSRAALTGGQLPLYREMFGKVGKLFKGRDPMYEKMWKAGKEMPDYHMGRNLGLRESVENVNWKNEIDIARLQVQKILDKHRISHPDNLRQGSKYKPSDYPEVPLEPTIRMILNKIKEN